MNVIVTLLIYWSIAAGLIGGGLFALARGFKLVLEGKGKTKEESSIQFLGLKVSVGSIGSLVMVTAFMWGWAAKQALPNYKDQEVEIHALMADLKETEAAVVSLRKRHADQLEQVGNLKTELSSARAALDESQLAITAAVEGRREKQTELAVMIVEQRKALDELQSAVKAGDPASVEENSKRFRDASIALERSVKKLF